MAHRQGRRQIIDPKRLPDMPTAPDNMKKSSPSIPPSGWRTSTASTTASTSGGRQLIATGRGDAPRPSPQA
jgi:hypothetical protein